MTLKEYLKQNRLTLTQLSEITEQSTMTLRNWFNNPKKRKLLEVVVQGARIERVINDY